MATGAEHYHEAERLLETADEAVEDVVRLARLQAAQVHATLAHAAATAYSANVVENIGYYCHGISSGGLMGDGAGYGR